MRGRDWSRVGGRFDRQWDRPYGLRLARGRGGDAAWGCCNHLAGREADTTVVTFEFDYLLDPIGPDQAPGASRFAPADAMTPTPGGSNDQPSGAATGVDADAWLIELLTERAPSAATTTDEDMTWLDEPVGAAAVPTALPRPVLDTRVDLPPPAALAGLAALIPGADPRPNRCAPHSGRRWIALCRVSNRRRSSADPSPWPTPSSSSLALT